MREDRVQTMVKKELGGRGGRGGGDKNIVRSCPRPQPLMEFVRGGRRGREKSSMNTCLFLTPNKSASS